MEVKGKIAVVTGAASGIGRAMARRFADEGAKGVVCADMNGDGAKSVADEFGGLGIEIDVTNEDEIKALVAETEAKVGPIDLFCSNAGISRGGDINVPQKDMEDSMNVHMYAHLYAARAVIPGMIERGGGYLFNTSSAAGLLTIIGSLSYAVSKHAAVSLAEWLAITYGDQGIKVSVLCPQGVRTAMTGGGDGGSAGLDGMLEPEELADYVMDTIREEKFLCLPHSEVLEYMQRKTSDYDRWLGGMRRLQERMRGQ